MMESQPVSIGGRDMLGAGMVSPGTGTPWVATCPRCRQTLAIIRPERRRVRGLTAQLCPSLKCGYKLIVPR